MKILLTGSTGFLGQLLIPYLLEQYNPSQIKLLGRNEGKMYQIIEKYNDKRLKPELGDVNDLLKMTSIVKDVDLVIHAAALKRVDLCNLCPQEAVKTNIIGTFNLLHACINWSKIKKLVYISTDKSLHPTNLYGKTKSVAESMLLERQKQGLPFQVTSVRWGNCISSTGAFFPKAIEAIKKGEDIYLTSREMTRFLMTKRMILEVIRNAIYVGANEIVIPKELLAINIGRGLEIIKDYFQSKSKVKISSIVSGEKLAEELAYGVFSDEKKYQVTREKFLELLKEEGLI